MPAAPALKDIATNDIYREALTHADVAIADSAFMVLAWNLLQGDSIQRLSGLKYLRELLIRPDVREPENTFWIMAGKASSEKNLAWLKSEGISVPAEFVYEAPMYGAKIEDPALIEKLEVFRPQHVIITVGGGTQERSRSVSEELSGLSPGDPLHRGCDCVSERRPGADSELGGPVLPGLAIPLCFSSAEIHPALSVGAAPYTADLALSGPASFAGRRSAAAVAGRMSWPAVML